MRNRDQRLPPGRISSWPEKGRVSIVRVQPAVVAVQVPRRRGRDFPVTVIKVAIAAPTHRQPYIVP